MSYLYLKAIHIIFVVTWFAGLFYIVRLFIYQTEALDRDEPEKTILSEQLAKMARLLWFVITWPSAVITLIMGLSLLITQPSWLQMPFMHLKLSFVALLFLYQFGCHHIYRKLQKGEKVFSSTQLRVYNEVATVLLIAIVFLIVLKDQLSWIWGTLGILGISVTLMIAIKLYKKIRSKS